MHRRATSWKAWILGAACGAAITLGAEHALAPRPAGVVVDLVPGDSLTVPVNGGTLRLVLEPAP